MNKILYTLKHKKQYLKTEYRLTGKITVKGLLHDSDKVLLYLLFPNKTVKKIHRYISKHHMESFWNKKDWVGAVIDWESARFTKSDKQLNARQTMEKYYTKYKEDIENVLILFDL